MEQRMSLITLGVADVTRSRAFYEALGWRAAGVSVESTAFFQLGGVVLSLWGRDALAADVGAAAHGDGFRGVAIAQNVRNRAEVDAVLAEATRAGGRLVKPGTETDWGGVGGYFADPDGHLWEVAWNPHFTIAEDGSLRLPR